MRVRHCVLVALFSGIGGQALADGGPKQQSHAADKEKDKDKDKDDSHGHRDDNRDHDDDDDHDDGDCERDHDRKTLFVDDDKQQCPRAQFTTINAAVAAAPPGGHIHVCPGTYLETVPIPKSLRLHGAGPSPEQRTADPNTEAVLIPVATQEFLLNASNIDLAGFTVTGSVSDAIFVNLGATGEQIRRNFLLDDGSAISMLLNGAPRQPTVIRHNRIQHAVSAISVASIVFPDPNPTRVTIVGNHVQRANVGLQLGRFNQSRASSNLLEDVDNGILFSEGSGSELSLNRIDGSATSTVGILLQQDNHNRVLGNSIQDIGGGPGSSKAGVQLVGSSSNLVAGNRAVRIDGDGINLVGVTASWAVFNQADDNAAIGIDLLSSAANSLAFNRMHGNAVFDASDDNRPANDWQHNDCDTDNPPGTICH